MFERILVPLDGSRFGEVALPRALELAERWEAALEIATVVDPQDAGADAPASPDVGDDVREVAHAHAKDYVSDVEERIRAGGYDGELVVSVITAGNVAHSLARHLRERKCDIAVMTTHGRGPIRRAWLGSSADALIRRSPVPVLLIRPEEKETARTNGGSSSEAPPRRDLSARPPPFRRLLVPLDGSSDAERMLPTAAPLVEEGSQSRCVLLRVVPPFIPGGSPYLPHVVREVESQAMVKQAAWDYLDSLRDRAPCAEVEEKVVTDAQAAQAILGTATEEAADVIAMSTAGRGGVTRLLLGSVADKVVRGANVPVLVYREPAKQS